MKATIMHDILNPNKAKEIAEKREAANADAKEQLTWRAWRQLSDTQRYVDTVRAGVNEQLRDLFQKSKMAEVTDADIRLRLVQIASYSDMLDVIDTQCG